MNYNEFLEMVKKAGDKLSEKEKEECEVWLYSPEEGLQGGIEIFIDKYKDLVIKWKNIIDIQQGG